MPSEFEVLPEEGANTPQDAEAQTDQAVFDGASPGQLLQEARAKLGLTIEDIVTQSRMSKETIRSLEEDRDPPQNAWVYVRGYYRKYARVLGIPEEEILLAHERHAGGIPAPEPVSAEWAPQDVSPVGGIPKFVIVLVVGILLGGLAWWAMPALMNGDSDSANATSNSLKKDMTPVAVQPAPEAAAEELVSKAQPVAETTSHADADPEPVVVEEKPETETAVKVEEVEESEAPETVHQAPASAQGPKLALEFIDRSWVNVVDASGKKLLDGIVRANAQLALEGQAPFKVFLGYAPGVKLSYDGKMIDTKPYTTSSNTAKFTVGGETSSSP